jgi:hypothetical protein
MRARLTLWVFASVACSTEHHAVDGRLADAESDAVDAPAPRCDLSKPFGTPVPVPGVNTASEETGGWISRDELRIYFTIGPAPPDPVQRDLYVATRSTTADDFGQAMRLDTVSSAATGDLQPSLTADELMLFFASGSTSDIYVSTRTDPQSAFGSPDAVVSVNGSTSADYDVSPWISEDGLTLYFASTRSGNYNFELYQATRSTRSAPFETPTIIPSLMSLGNDSAPVVRGDGLEMFFASNREQVMYPEGYTNDIYRATRVATTAAWGAPEVVMELAAPTNEGPTWISSDGCVLVFSGSRAGAGSYDIWMTTRG